MPLTRAAAAALLAAALLCCAGAAETELDAIMPPFEANHEDAYLCTTVALPDKQLKLIGIEPLSKQEVVHHMLLFGCKEPASQDTVFDCRMRSACSGGGESVLYGWGKNAPKMALPKDTGFSVGKGTGITSIVLQVHYLKPRPANDTSGVRLRLGEAPVTYSAGMVAFAAGFTVPPRRPSYLVPNECCYTGFEALRGFAFRVHTHALGRAVYLQRGAGGAVDPAAAPHVAEQDPQLPQGFYPLDPRVLVLPGDRLRMTCDFNSSGSAASVSAGHTSAHEMCNLYLMLYGRLPFFMWCLDGGEYTELAGPGGVDARSRLAPEAAEWRPPAAVESGSGAGKSSAAMGQVAGVATAPDDPSVWVLHRGDVTWDGNSFDGSNRITAKNPISGPMVVKLDADSGAVTAAWGSGLFYMPHMITPDYEGNLWVTDVGLHQAIKFSASGEKLLELGTKLAPGRGPAAFCMPTQVAVGRDGSVYVADGYCNSRVAKFDAKGAWQRDYEMPEGSEPLSVPHSVVVHECRGLLYVADREGGAVHAFDLGDGSLKGSWETGPQYGLPYALALGPYGTVLALTWRRERGGGVSVVALGSNAGAFEADWEVPVPKLVPHDLALAAAPLSASGVGERLLSVLVAETAPSGSRLHKFVLLPHGMGSTDAAAAAEGGEKEEEEGAAGADEAAAAALAASHLHDTKLKRIDGGGGQQGGEGKGSGGYASVLEGAGESGEEREQRLQLPTGGAATQGGGGDGAAALRAEAEEQQQRQDGMVYDKTFQPQSSKSRSHASLGTVALLLAIAAAAFLALRRNQSRRGYHPPGHVGRRTMV